MEKQFKNKIVFVFNVYVFMGVYVIKFVPTKRTLISNTQKTKLIPDMHSGFSRVQEN